LIRLGNVSQPTLSVFHAHARKVERRAIVVCPGGLQHLALDLKDEVAEWFNDLASLASC